MFNLTVGSLIGLPEDLPVFSLIVGNMTIKIQTIYACPRYISFFSRERF